MTVLFVSVFVSSFSEILLQLFSLISWFWCVVVYMFLLGKEFHSFLQVVH